MIEHNAYIVVSDGKRASVYRNSGTTQAPHLETISAVEQKNPSAHEQGTDKAGSVHASSGSARSHVAETDYHEAQEHAFAKDIMHSIVGLVERAHVPALIWVAPPRMLASLRADMPKKLKDITTREIDKDLTKHAPNDILKLISK